MTVPHTAEMRDGPGTLLWAPEAWIEGRWQAAVVLRIAGDGCWASVQANAPAPPDATVLSGPVLPGLVNAHSHAFQRAFAGLAERRDGTHDDFWAWRDRMYRVAAAMTPELLRAIAAQLYVELLRGGYTHVCEFHYLRHASGEDGSDPLALSWSLADAAADAGIGLTLLPVVYERAGFDGAALAGAQLQFAQNVQQAIDAHDAIARSGRPQLCAGIALHSLRAVPPSSVRALQQQLQGRTLPIHIHVAEQTAEVDACLQTHGQRPVEWLAAQPGLLDPRWQLVHATHALPQEVERVAACGAGVVLCPSTEANLGDGLTDLPAWLHAGVPLAIGSDSQITRTWREELRWLEYGQRLQLRQRNVAAQPERGLASSAQVLWGSALEGGRRAAGLSHWGLVPGARADLLVVDSADISLRAMPAGHLLDALIFSSPARPWRDVMVAGRWGTRAHQRDDPAVAIGARYLDAMQQLWGGTATA